MRTRLSWMMGAVAIVAVLIVGANDWSRRRDRCLTLATWHASNAAEYRRNARGSEGVLRIADWHDHMRDVFVRTASRPWEPIPQGRSSPP